MFCHRIRISLLVLKFGCGLRVDNISNFSRQILHLGAGVWPAAVYYKQTKEGEGWPEVEVGGERGRVERGNILAQGGAHRGKTHRCRDWNWGCYTDCWVWWELKNSQTWNITVFIRHGTRDNLSFQRFEYLMWIWLCWLWKLPCLLYFECRKANRYQKYKSVELALATVEQEDTGYCGYCGTRGYECPSKVDKETSGKFLIGEWSPTYFNL